MYSLPITFTNSVFQSFNMNSYIGQHIFCKTNVVLLFLLLSKQKVENAVI